MSSQHPLVSVIIVNWNTRDLIDDCLTSVEGQLADTSHETIVIDNASTDDSVDLVRGRFPQARVVVNAENRGFGCANNQGMEIARGHLFLLLNSDARLPDKSIGSLIELPGGVACCSSEGSCS